jgi:hypothetical protein
MRLAHLVNKPLAQAHVAGGAVGVNDQTAHGVSLAVGIGEERRDIRCVERRRKQRRGTVELPTPLLVRRLEVPLHPHREHGCVHLGRKRNSRDVNAHHHLTGWGIT